MVEGITFRIRQILLERYKEGNIDLLAEQIIVLSEISVELKNNGSIKKRQKYFDFKSMVLFTYKTYCGLYNKLKIYEKYISDSKYIDFNESIKMRNRITHPKSGADVFISGEDILKVISAGEWFHEFTFAIFINDLISQE